jgi:periplasmic divalent cation tolerance protein
MSEHGEVQITCGSPEEADLIAHQLVERRLAACVQRFAIASVYEWDGAIQDDQEVLLLVKTRTDHFDAIAELVTQLHSYELPAITMVPLTGTRAYLDWIDRSLTPPAAG